MSLQIRDLKVYFGPRAVVEGVNLSVERTQIVGLAGESGSGKSMTANAVLGLAEHMGATVRGSVELDGEELVGAPQNRLRRHARSPRRHDLPEPRQRIQSGPSGG